MFNDFYQSMFTTNLEVSEWKQSTLTFPSINRYTTSVLQDDLRD